MKLGIPMRLFVNMALLGVLVSACTLNNTATDSSTSQIIPISGATQPPTLAPTPVPTIQPGIAPINLPEKRSDQASDIDSSVDAAKKRVPGGDTFITDLFERPFNANTMEIYFPYLDIVDTQVFKDDTWGYATITLKGGDANGHLPGKYGIEIDLNKDGRGDWLILVSDPSSADWSTKGVQAWKDTNGDVGGIIPLVADKALSNGNGYETLVFDEGKNGGNPDDAWARISPDDNKTLIVAFKLSMLGDPKSYAVGAWAGTDLDPALFDFNDHMTHLQAGDPDPDLLLYAIKGLSEIDNTCRMAVGFASTGQEPGLCLTIIKHREPDLPGNPPPPPNPNGRGPLG